MFGNNLASESKELLNKAQKALFQASADISSIPHRVKHDYPHLLGAAITMGDIEITAEQNIIKASMMILEFLARKGYLNKLPNHDASRLLNDVIMFVIDDIWDIIKFDLNVLIHTSSHTGLGSSLLVLIPMCKNFIVFELLKRQLANQLPPSGPINQRTQDIRYQLDMLQQTITRCKKL